jgi:type IV pilus assembly protein PilB
MKADIDAVLEETSSNIDTNGEDAIETSSIETKATNPRMSLLDNLNLVASLEDAPEEDASSNMDLEATNTSPIINLVDKILIQALSSGTSDIHIEPQDDGLVIRLRHDGVLEQLEVLPKNIIPAITSRLKIMADLDIAERRLPQDGRIRRMFRGRVFDLRVSTLPTRFGEKVCLRLLDSGSTKLGLDKLISNPTALADVRDMGSKPYGMILVTGQRDRASQRPYIHCCRSEIVRASTSLRSKIQSNTASKESPKPRSTERRATTLPGL